jgi:hypothetical protein
MTFIALWHDGGSVLYHLNDHCACPYHVFQIAIHLWLFRYATDDFTEQFFKRIRIYTA